MPDGSQHIKLALHSIDTINYLLAKKGFSDWAAIVTFYASLHIIDTVLFCDPKAPIKHGITHERRGDVLKGTTHYTEIYRHYAVISRASRIARYLEDKNTGNVMLFDYYMPHNKVRDVLIKHNLWRLIKSAANFLPDKLAGLLTTKFNKYFVDQPETQTKKG